MTISYLRFERPRSMFAAMSFGNCGYAFPCIIGAKLAAPDRPAIAYVGEGAWGMSFNEILTCVREKIPVTAVVFNNRQWGAEKKNQVDFYSERFLGTNLENPSFAAIARTMGAEGYVIEQLSDVGPALQAACKAQTEGRTTVLEMMVTLALLASESLEAILGGWANQRVMLERLERPLPVGWEEQRAIIARRP